MFAALLFALGSATAAVVSEVFLRQHHGLHAVPFVMSALIVLGLFRLIAVAPSLIAAMAAYSLMTMTLRAAASVWVLHEPLTGGQLAAILLMFMAVVARYAWR